MNKTIKILLLSLIPLILGYLINIFIFVIPTSLFSLIQYVFLVLWGVLAYFLLEDGESLLKNVLLQNVLAALFLVLLLIQELAVKAYWQNLIGTISQLYYTPILVPAFFIAGFFNTSGIWLAYIFEFILMLAVSLTGCLIKRRKIR
ncbi:MAG: hypothetical protein ACI3VB_09545 [Oscillospiraceae bacterium]